ncbi:MAG: spermine synthase, partial [Bacillota bacterium]|nr:spermine synthase [Bacillota bacterium]
VIGPGGGRDILLAMLAGSSDITAVEINRSAVAAVKEFAGYNGDLYSLPGVNTVIRDGRNYIETTDRTFDTIYLSLVMTQAAETRSLALAENYVYTSEAFTKYLSRLSNDGQVVFLTHDENDAARIVATALSVLGQEGISYADATAHVSVVATALPPGHASPNHLHYPAVIIRKKAFTSLESSTLYDVALRNGLDPVFIPGVVTSNRMPLTDFQSVDGLVKAATINIAPTTDERPFFYNFGAGTPLPIVIVVLAATGVLTVLFQPLYRTMQGFTKRMAIYFFLLGIGYMALESALIQKNALLLGHPTLSFLVSVPLLLGASGTGSLLGARLRSRLKVVLVVLSMAILAAGAIYRWAMPYLLSSSPLSQVVVAALIVLPLGFLMGIPFPSGLSRMYDENVASAIPLMWGLNGVASLLGSALAIIAATYFGFAASFLIAALAYSLATRAYVA